MLAEAVPMAKRKGAAVPDPDERGDDAPPGGSLQIRIADDLAEMVAVICDVEPHITAAQLVDPLLRPEIVARFHSLGDAGVKVLAARRALAEAKKAAAEYRKRLRG